MRSTRDLAGRTSAIATWARALADRAHLDRRPLAESLLEPAENLHN